MDIATSLGLFTSSVLGTMFLLRQVQNSSVRSPFGSVPTTWRNIRNKCSSNSSDHDYDDYNHILSQLFRPIKTTSRHVESQTPRGDKVTQSNDDLFLKRKDFFQNLARTSGLKTDNVIHVTGSKGKGSVVEHIASALRNSGEQVGIFTSPHLHSARERIKINAELISRADLSRLGRMILKQTVHEYWAVFFDLFLGCAIQHFGEKNVDYLVLEVGIGGRYDSTNFLDNARIGVITSISYDHMDVLGDTLTQIAWQKAGIIKPGMHVFTPSSQEASAVDVIVQQCKEKNATLHIVPVEIVLESELSIGSHGFSVQQQNAALALAVVRHLGLKDSSMQGFYWPCRMEAFEVRIPQLDLSPTSTSSTCATVVLDGAHNGNSVQMFLAGLRERYPGRHVHVIFGAGLEKCVEDMLSEIHANCDSVCLVQSRHFKAASEMDLHAVAVKAGFLLPIPAFCKPQERAATSTVEVRLRDAIQRSAQSSLEKYAGSDASSRPVIAVCGSLFAAAEAREVLFAMDPTLFSEADWVREQDRI